MESKITEKQFSKELGSFKGSRSTLKRWKRAYYTKNRTETPLSYFLRLSSYRK